VLVNNEDAKEAEYNRMRAAMHLHGIGKEDFKHPIILHPQRVTFFKHVGPRSDPQLSESGKDFLQAVRDIRTRHKDIAVIVFDTFSSICAGLEENSATDMTYVLNFLTDLAVAADCAILFAHHKPKIAFKGGPGVGRGSSAIGGAVRNIVDLDYPEAHEVPMNTEAHNWIKVAPPKSKGAPITIADIDMAFADLGITIGMLRNFTKNKDIKGNSPLYRWRSLAKLIRQTAAEHYNRPEQSFDWKKAEHLGTLLGRKGYIVLADGKWRLILPAPTVIIPDEI
jgi:hypothetical protein